MQFKFDQNQDFQLSAINACVNVFAGQANQQGLFAMPLKNPITPQQGHSNQCSITPQIMWNNVQNIQHINGVNSDKTELGKPQFTIEMETGTGKTYVYLRTIFEMHAQYNFKKFIIVVPSVAIREGVLKSLQQMQKHFEHLYNNIDYNYFNYNSKNPQKIRQFAQSNILNIMIINIDSFNKEKNIFNSFNEDISGIPADFVKGTNPIVIIDEPQNMDSGIAQHSLTNLNPLATFGFSATHKNVHHKLYELNPVQAYNRKLVKQIEVIGNITQNDHNTPYIKLISVNNTQSPITATIAIDVKQATGIKRKTIKIKQNDDLAKKTKRSCYNGYIIKDIYCGKGNEYINFTNKASPIMLGHSIGDIDNDIVQKQQIAQTIESHLDKQFRFNQQNKNIKVLSLFFIDRVANYRTSKNGEQGKYAQWFAESFNEILQNNPKYKSLYKTTDISQIHNGYFSQDTKGYKDTKGNSTADNDTYSLIMKDKEKLLNFNEPLQFIFSHSALREGWDNPNVFQICTLNETQSTIKKRQELGRGLRLCVNQNGDRIHDEKINILTVICNESYDEFATTLQTEYENDTGEKFKKENIINAKNNKDIQYNKTISLSPEFKELWDKIKRKTKYKIKYNPTELIENCTAHFAHEHTDFNVKSIKITKQTALINEITEHGLQVTGGQPKTLDENQNITFDTPPDILSYIQAETYLSRKTIAQILKQSNTLHMFQINPTDYMDKVAKIINTEKLKLIVAGIQYEKIDECYEQGLLNPSGWINTKLVNTENDNHIQLGNNSKHLYDYALCDSGIEKSFAQDCNNDETVLAFTKLPSLFKIKTPLGSYNPDWAILRNENGEEKVYFVVETKGTNELDKLTPEQRDKITCAKKHFKEIANTNALNYKAPIKEYGDL